MPDLESPTEVARRGGIRDRARAEGIEESLILAAHLDIIEHRAAADEIVGDVENRVGFAIGMSALQDWQSRVQRRHQSNLPGELMNGADPAVRDGLDTLRCFVPNCASGELGAGSTRLSSTF